MVKTVALVLAGLAAGFAVAFMLKPSAPSGDDPSAEPGAPAAMPVMHGDAASTARVAALEDALAAEAEQRALLEARLDELTTQIEELRASAARAPDARNTNEQRFPDPAAVEQFIRDRVPGPVSADELERRQIERLVAAGFAPDRAEWINRRTQELRMQALQAQYDATRAGRPLDATTALAGERTLRSELGDADYERYLTALNRPTSVAVRDVLASSPAERAGLEPGDEVVAYDGQRVFDMNDLNALTFEGAAGESVIVEVQRGGQNIRLLMPRGPLGVTGGGAARLGVVPGGPLRGR